MPELIARTPLAGQAPLLVADLRLAEVDPGPITSVAPLKGRDVGPALASLGLDFPAPNTLQTAGGARLVWTGRGQAFLFGPVPEGLAEAAALTDQSDGWASLRLEGPGAEDALMRLYPLDLRLASFPQGRAVRAPLGHMASILMRDGPESFTLMVFRSMAKTAWHEIETVLHALAARAAAS